MTTFIDQVQLYIDSKDRTKGQSEKFTLEFDNPIERVTSVEVIGLEIPFSFYVISKSNGILTFEDNSNTTFSCTIDPGMYTGSSLATELQSKLNAQLLGFTVTYDSETMTITIVNAVPFKIKLHESTIRYMLNISDNSELSTSWTSGKIDVTRPIYPSNGTLSFGNGTGDTYSVTLGSGNYTGITIASTLQTEMNKSDFKGFTVSYQTDSYKMLITNAADFKINYTLSTIREIIGITEDVKLTKSVLLPGIVNLSGPNYLFIKSHNLMRAKVRRPYDGKEQSDILYKIPIVSGPGTTIIDKKISSTKVNYASRQKITSIDLTLTDPDDNVVDLNGQRWALTLMIEIS